MRALLVFERVDVGHQVAAHAIGVDHFLDARSLAALISIILIEVVNPAHRLVRNAKVGEHLVVETALAEKQLVDLLEEFSRASALNHAVVIGRGKCDGLADALLCECGFAHALKLGRVVERTGTDDAAGTLHQAWHRVNGSDASWVGERNGRTGEVVGTELVVASTLNEVFVGDEVFGEVELLRALDVWH